MGQHRMAESLTVDATLHNALLFNANKVGTLWV
jgi:hypothetical protein